MKHWVFDLDGTLVDSFSHYFKALEEIFNHHGAKFTDDLRLPALTYELTVFFEEHLGKENVKRAFSNLQIKSNEHAKHIRTFSGMENVVKKLVDQGSQVGIWTNRDLVSAELILQSSGLKKYTQTCISGTCVNRRKPDPEGLLRIISLFDCKPEEVTMVGDHVHDVTAAKAVGARAVRASWHSYWPIEKCAHSDVQFHEISDFEAWVKRLHP